MIGVVAGDIARAKHLIGELGLEPYPRGTALAITNDRQGRGASLDALLFDDTVEIELTRSLLPCLARTGGQAYRLTRII